MMVHTPARIARQLPAARATANLPFPLGITPAGQPDEAPTPTDRPVSWVERARATRLPTLVIGGVPITPPPEPRTLALVISPPQAETPDPAEAEETANRA